MDIYPIIFEYCQKAVILASIRVPQVVLSVNDSSVKGPFYDLWKMRLVNLRASWFKFAVLASPKTPCTYKDAEAVHLFLC